MNPSRITVYSWEINMYIYICTHILIKLIKKLINLKLYLSAINIKA